MHRLGGGGGGEGPPFNPSAYPFLAFPGDGEEVTSNLPPPQVNYNRGGPLGPHLFGSHPLATHQPPPIPRSRYRSLEEGGGGGIPQVFHVFYSIT